MNNITPPSDSSNSQGEDTNFKDDSKKIITLNPDAFNGLDSDAVLNKYMKLQISETTNIPPPMVSVRINNEIICSEGNITTISGPSKSGKSAFISVLLAGCIAVGDYDGFPDMKIEPTLGKAAIHFDTEQSRHKHQKNIKSILRRCGLNESPPNLLSYNIREEELENYLCITSEIAEAANQKFNGIQMIVVDGGADYIRDVNEPNQSNALVKFFLDLASKYKTSVIVIVHLNPNSDKERGHFGSQLQRKSESVLTIKTENDISCMGGKFLREAGKDDVPLIQFQYDKEKGYHTYCGTQTPTEIKNVKDQKHMDELRRLAQIVFAPPSSYSYAAGIERIMRETHRQKATAKSRFTEMNIHQLIIKGDDGNWRLNIAEV